jgi:DMSO reductase anchor subunit
VSGDSGKPPEERILEIHKRAGAAAPAVGARGGPAPWKPEGESVAGAAPDFADARWSFLYGADTNYERQVPGTDDSPPAESKGTVPLFSRANKGTVPLSGVRGPMMNAPVWTWEVPVYFWLGGLASGASFVALGADLAGDARSAEVCRRLALGAVVPCAPLLIMDLGRPMRFLNMLRVFKPRSPMSMGAWCLMAFSTTAAGAVGADVIGRRREARALGGVTAVLGTYLGSYTGALLAATAVPLWARSRAYLGPIFVCTAVGSGASASRLVLRPGPTRTAAGHTATAAMAAELVVSHLNERRLDRLGEALGHGKPGRLFRSAKALTAAGLALRAARRPGASPLFLAAGLLYRFAWIEGGKASARDDEAVALTARDRTP